MKRCAENAEMKKKRIAAHQSREAKIRKLALERKLMEEKKREDAAAAAVASTVSSQ